MSCLVYAFHSFMSKIQLQLILDTILKLNKMSNSTVFYAVLFVVNDVYYGMMHFGGKKKTKSIS